ncbi:hypothetical protein [Mycolicibacterium stellerae]|uniref:hypothetical protein n=1 Tax=Mycolicibacterium stellerae TaxID=2358193 RepID=UPI000F0B07BD|nr:hypothetical protein [Mycolicibacterium stellerae]
MSRTADDGAIDDELRQYAFHMEPQLVADGDTWTASYPGADWSVTGCSGHEALQRLGEEFIRRQTAGEDPLAYADSVYRRHLRDPVDGVYAVDNELYRELVHAPADERERTIKEAERRRRLGLAYTLSDYRRNSLGD